MPGRAWTAIAGGTSVLSAETWLVSVMMKNESFFACLRRPGAAHTDSPHRSSAGSRRHAAESWAGIGRVRLCFDFADRRGQAARFENFGGELRHNGIRPDFSVDALDLYQELRGLLDEFRRVRRETVGQCDADVSPTSRFRRRSKGRLPQRLLREAGGLRCRHAGNLHRILWIGEVLLGVQLRLQPSLDDIRALRDQRLRHGHKAAIALVDRRAGCYLARQLI